VRAVVSSTRTTGLLQVVAAFPQHAAALKRIRTLENEVGVRAPVKGLSWCSHAKMHLASLFECCKYATSCIHLSIYHICMYNRIHTHAYQYILCENQPRLLMKSASLCRVRCCTNRGRTPYCTVYNLYWYQYSIFADR
jgi:hypothetical protein